MSMRDPSQYVERRRKRDWVTRAVPIIAAIGWLAAIVMLVLLDRASPTHADFFSRLAGKLVVSSWNTQMLQYVLLILVGVFVICLVGFILNLLRHKRKTDKFNMPIIVLGIASVIGIVAFLIAFGKYIF